MYVNDRQYTILRDGSVTEDGIDAGHEEAISVTFRGKEMRIFMDRRKVSIAAILALGEMIMSPPDGKSPTDYFLISHALWWDLAIIPRDAMQFITPCRQSIVEFIEMIYEGRWQAEALLDQTIVWSKSYDPRLYMNQWPKVSDETRI